MKSRKRAIPKMLTPEQERLFLLAVLLKMVQVLDKKEERKKSATERAAERALARFTKQAMKKRSRRVGWRWTARARRAKGPL